MYIVSLEESDIVWLAWAAGMAQGSGNTSASAAITGILNRMESLDGREVPEDPSVEWAEDDVPGQDRTPDPRFTPPVVSGRDFEGGAGPPPSGGLS